jgi:hypothetical protein
MKLKTALLVIVLLILKEKSNAQFGMGKVEDIKDLQTRTLVVVLRKEDPKTVKSLAKKPNDLKNYQKNIENYNTNFKLAMEHSWPYKQEFKYVGLTSDTWQHAAKDEIEKALEKKDKDHYAYIMQTASNYSYRTYSNGFYQRDVTGLLLSSLVVGFGDKNMAVGEMKLPFVDPSEADFIYGIQQMMSYFDYRLNEKSRKELKAEMSKNSLKLKEKTLLLDKELLEKGLTEQEIKTVYPYPFKITDRAEMDEAIINKDNKYAYVQVVAVSASTAGKQSKGAGTGPVVTGFTKSSLTYLQYVVDAQGGTILGYAGGGGKLAGFSAGEHEIKKKHFKDYLKGSEDDEDK